MIALRFNNIFKLLLFIALFGFVFMVSGESSQAATIKEDICRGANANISASGSTDCATGVSDDRPNRLIRIVINLFSVVVGIIAVLMIFLGGFKYITSSGDSGKVSEAKKTILYAIIGLVIVAVAQFLVEFVLKTSSDGIKPPTPTP